MELAKFGEIEEMVVCDNVGDHLVGNVYVQYHYEEQAGNAVDDLNKRFYAGKFSFLFFLFLCYSISKRTCSRSQLTPLFCKLQGRPLYAELSPVTDFKEACCRQHEIAECNRGGFCNFMHLKHPRRALRRELFEAQRASIKEKKREEKHGDERRKDRSGSPRHHTEERPAEANDEEQASYDPESKRARLEEGAEYRP
jgi:splicing factor U2AF subunit